MSAPALLLRWLLVGLLCVTAHARDKQCYWNSKDAYTYFSTVTPYDDVRGDIRDEPVLEGCEPCGLWALVRHGTRHPNAAVAALMKETGALREDIVASYHAGRGEMCAQDIQDLANWTWDNSLEEEPMYLTKEGWSELQQLGLRVRSRFGALLASLDEALFRATDTQRTRASARAFLAGLGNDTFTIADPLEPDELARPYKFCDKYVQDKANDTRFDEEEKKFHETDDYQQLVHNTRRRLGLPALTPAQVSGLYQLCRHERARAHARRHAWCAVFQQQDLPVLEYLEDLQDHYERGYGSRYAARLGALPLKHLRRSVERAVGAAGAAGVGGARRLEGYFSHDTALQMLFTALGLFHDYPPISGLRLEPGRRWRSSLMTPFAANIIVVVNKCEVNGTASDAAGTQRAAAATHLVQVFVNERAVPLCGARACAWPVLRDMLLPFANTTMDFCSLTSDETLHYE